MAELYRFFGNGPGDTRQYNQEDFAKVLSRLLKNGYFPGIDGELQVTVCDPAAMAVQVGIGEAWINGYWYRNDDVKILTINPASATLNRIDRAVLRLDVVTNRLIVAEIKQGTAASNPVPPELTRTSQMYEISLAQIYVGAGVTSILAENITDERADATLCGRAVTWNDKDLRDYADTKVANTEVVTTAQANKIVKTDNNAKLPVSVTGDAGSVGGKTLDDLDAMFMHEDKVSGTASYSETFQPYQTKTYYISLPSNKYKNGLLIVSDVLAFFGTNPTKYKCVGEYSNSFGSSPSVWSHCITDRSGSSSSYGSTSYISIRKFYISGNQIIVEMYNTDDEVKTNGYSIDWEVW